MDKVDKEKNHEQMQEHTQQLQQQMQQRFLELTLQGEEIKQLEQQLALLEAQLVAFQQLRSDLEELKEGKTMLANLGGKVFAKTKLLDDKKVLVNIGSSYVVEKGVEEAKDILEKQILQLQEFIGNFRTELFARAENLGRIEQEINKMQDQSQGQY